MDIDRLEGAGREILDFLVGKYRSARGIHSETILGAAAALAEIMLGVSRMAPLQDEI